MKVKQLIEKLKDAEPDALVVTSASDHKYRIVDAYSCEAEIANDIIAEYYEDIGTMADGKVVPVVVID